MHTQIYVNLPVASFARSRAFFEALGYRFEPKFTNEVAGCLVLGENLHAMLLERSFFQSFTTKTIVDAREAVEVLVCVSCADRAAVDALVAKAVEQGATVPRPPVDHGFMYQHAYEDLDGHTWELVAYAPPPEA